MTGKKNKRKSGCHGDSQKPFPYGANSEVCQQIITRLPFPITMATVFSPKTEKSLLHHPSCRYDNGPALFHPSCRKSELYQLKQVRENGAIEENTESSSLMTHVSAEMYGHQHTHQIVTHCYCWKDHHAHGGGMCCSINEIGLQLLV